MFTSSMLENYNVLDNMEFTPSMLQEAFFGRNPLLDQIEGEFQKIIDASKSSKHVNVNSYVTKIEDLTVELFNFKTVSLGISNVISNALSIGIDTGLTAKIKKGKYGPMFEKPVKHGVFVVDINVATVQGATAAEMTALYLHEVGHAMYMTSIFTKLQSLATFIATLAYYAAHIPQALALAAIGHAETLNSIVTSTVINTFARFPLFNKIVGKILKTLTDNIALNNTFVNEIIGILAFIGKFMSPLTLMKNFKANAGSIPIPIGQLIMLPYQYGHERFSDNFASSFGYGNELASALSKLQNDAGDLFERALMDSGDTGMLLVNITNLMTLPMAVITELTDPHPSTHTRILDQIKMAKYDLKTGNLKPELKKDLEKQLEELEKTLERNTTAMATLDGNKNVVKHYMAALMINTVGTDSLRDALMDLFRPRALAMHQVDVK